MTIELLARFIERAKDDYRIGPQHLALYIVFFVECWKEGSASLLVSQAGIASSGKIGRSSYHKCMRELHLAGYIRYTPSYNPFLGSLVQLLELS